VAATVWVSAVRPLAQDLFDPGIDLLAFFADETDVLSGFQEGTDPLPTPSLYFAQADCQSSACHLLQAHLVLELTQR